MPAPHTRDLLDYAPILAMVIAIGVAVMQAYLQRQQRKQTLFDRRFKVYQETIAYLMTMLQLREDADLARYQVFRTETDPGEFMFASDVFDFIKDVGRTGLEYWRLQGEIRDHTIVTSNRITGSNQVECDRRFSESLAKIPLLQHEVRRIKAEIVRLVEGEAKAVFVPYLRLHYGQSWLRRLSGRVNRWVDDDQPVKLASRYDS
jgi:hypothetical protein